MSDRTVILPVKMSDEDRKALVQYAKDNNTTAADIVRSLLSDYLDKRTTFSGELEQRGGDRRSKSYRQRRAAS